MNNIASVKTIRQNITIIQAHPGIYRWWFPVNKAKKIIWKLGGRYDIDELLHKHIDGNDYVALYFGEAGGKGLLRRIEDHLTQTHTPSLVRHGGLSILRQTLCAIEGLDMSSKEGEDRVNAIMNECWLEWDYTNDAQEAKTLESKELSTNCYPLNIQKNTLADNIATARLKELRKTHKK